MTDPTLANKIFVTPKEGATVIDTEKNSPVPPEGSWVVHDKYIRRRIEDGDAIVSEPSTPSKKASR